MKANAVISGAMNNRAASSGFQTEMTRYRLGDVADVIVGYPFDGHKYSRDGVPVVRGENVTIGALRWDIKKCWIEDFPLADEYSLQDEDIVIGMDGSRVGRNRAQITMQDLPLLLAQRVACVRAKAGLYDQSFLYYQIFSQSFESYVNTIQSGSAVPHISQKQIEDFPVSGLDFTKQRVIGKFLSALDRKIALNRRKIATLEKMAKEIYDYWFVQYDFPDANGRPYKSSGGEMVYSPELKREIPKGWRSSSLGEIMQIERKTIDPSSIPHQVIEHYSIPAFDENMYPAFCRASEIQSSKFKIDSEVVLLSKLNPKFKRIWDPPVIGEYSLCSTEFIVCKAKQPRDKPFIFEVLNSDSVQRYMIDGASSSTGSRSRFAAELLPDFPLTIPPQSVIDSFTRIAKLSHAQIKNLRIDITNLTALRDFLLPLLMSGHAQIGGAAE